MAEGDKIEEGVLEQLVQKLWPCIGRGELDACVEEAAQLADKMGISADELLGLAGKMGIAGKHKFAYVLALGAVSGLDGYGKGTAYYNAGLAAQSLGNLGKAKSHYLKAIKINSGDAMAHNDYANVCRELNGGDEAEIHYQSAIEADSNYTAAYSNYAILLEELNRKDEAENQYRKAIEIDPYFAAAHYNYALLLDKLNRKDEAENQCIKAIESNPNYAIAYHYYAILLEELDRKDEAESQYRKAIEVDPSYALAHYNYAVLLRNLNRKDQSKIHYIKAIESDPKLAVARNNYANFLREHGKFAEAEAEIMCVFQIAQDDPSSQKILPYAHGTLGDIFANEDCYEDAESEYQKALDKSDSMDNSSISEMHNDLGWVYVQMGKYAKAEKEIKKARVLDPMNIKAKRNLRALARIRYERKPDDMSVIQIFLGGVLFFLLVVAYAMFFISMLSEIFFVAQATAILLFILILLDIISKATVGKNGLAVEGGTGHMYMLDKQSMKKSVEKSKPIIEKS